MTRYQDWDIDWSLERFLERVDEPELGTRGA
jgi:hypothetical protein